MSARPLSMAGQRPSALTLTNSTLFGSLKSAVATSRAMSMSKPTSWPLSSLKANGGTVVSVTTISLPRSRTTSSLDFSSAPAGRPARSSRTMATVITTARDVLMRTSFGKGHPRRVPLFPSLSWGSSRLPEEQRADRRGVFQHGAEPGEGGVHRRRELARPAEPRQRLGRDELEQDVGAPGRHADEVHGQHVVVLQQEHAERRRGLERHDRRRLAYAAPLHGDGQHVVGEELGRR